MNSLCGKVTGGGASAVLARRRESIFIILPTSPPSLVLHHSLANVSHPESGEAPGPPPRPGPSHFSDGHLAVVATLVHIISLRQQLQCRWRGCGGVLQEEVTVVLVMALFVVPLVVVLETVYFVLLVAAVELVVKAIVFRAVVVVL